MEEFDDQFYSGRDRDQFNGPSSDDLPQEQKQKDTLVQESGGNRTDIEKVRSFFQMPIRNIISNSDAGIFISDEEDNFIWMNDIVAEDLIDINLLLNKKSVIVFEYLQEFVQNPQAFSQRVKGLLKRRKPYYDEKILLKNGSIINMDYLPVFEGKTFRGAIWRLLATRDRLDWSIGAPNAITSFTETLDRFSISFCEVTEEGRILSTSPYFLKFSGYRKKDLIDHNFLELCVSGRENLRFSIKEGGSELLATNTCSHELEVQLKENTKWVQCHGFYHYVEDIGTGSWMLYMTEITEQKVIQQELEKAKEHAEQARMAQQQFLASMSHDIRTPLNAIIGMTLLMAETKLSEQQEGYVKVLKNASNILLDLLNGVLDFAKIESGKQEIRRKEFDLPKLLNSLIETFSFKLSEKPVVLNCHIDPKIDRMIIGDDIVLNQVLMNLLTNAEKFTEEGEINLIAKVEKTVEDTLWIEFKVKDTGIGISKENIGKIFQDFTQDDNVQLNHGGSGLGLFICKRLVELMGGSVSVESIPKKGTTFTFSLPFVLTRKMIEQEMTKAESAYEFQHNNFHLLIVEDNQMNLKYLSSLLEQYNISFDVAMDGQTAMEKAFVNYYDLILMDMRLPGKSGLEITAELREKENPNAASPVILVSAEAFKSTINKAKKAGANEMLTKPYTPEQLVSILKKYLVEEEEEEEEVKDYSFKFNERLDIAYLDKLYAGNSNYAMSLFDVFLEYAESDWAEIQHFIEQKEWEDLKNQVHKVKPNFSMVGLTQITDEMQEVYNKLKKHDHKAAVGLLQKIQEELDEYMPLIKEEFERMRQYLLNRSFPK